MTKIDALLDELVASGGTDMYLGAGAPPLVRIRGELTKLRDRPLGPQEVEELVDDLLTPAQRMRLASDFELDFAVAHGDAARFRGSLFTKSTGLGAIFRRVPHRVPTLAELGAPDALARLSERRGGLVIVAGPAASGRSTTVAAMVDHVNRTRAVHVVTIEDPLEFLHESDRALVTQREVGTHVPSVAMALRTVRRESADVVVVSELASAEAFRLALDLAASGVLVVASVFSSTTIGVLEKIANAFSPAERSEVRALLASSLAGVVAQQLVRADGGKARIAVHEVLLGTPAVAAMIREARGRDLVTVMQSGHAQGMQTMDAALERLFVKGRIGAEAAFERASDKEAFARIVTRPRADAP